MKKKQIKTESNLKTTKTERRKKFNKWIDMDMYRKSKGSSAQIKGIGDKPEWFCEVCGKRVSKMTKTDGIWRCGEC